MISELERLWIITIFRIWLWEQVSPSLPFPLSKLFLSNSKVQVLHHSEFEQALLLTNVVSLGTLFILTSLIFRSLIYKKNIIMFTVHGGC